jgi:hypothetical protein
MNILFVGSIAFLSRLGVFSARSWPNVGIRRDNQYVARSAQRRTTSSSDGWRAVGWSTVALLAAGALGALALPSTSPTPFTTFERSDFVRPEWLVLATLLAYPVYLAARSHWIVAAPLVAILAAENWYVVDTALDSLHQVGLTAPTRDALLVGFVALQAALFAATAVVGGWRCLERSRWLRRMRRLVPELADANVVGSDASTAGHGGSFSTG